MKKPNTKIDWTIIEEDNAWQSGQNAALPQTTLAHKSSRSKELALATLLAALLPLLLGAWLWQRPSPAKTPATRPSATIIQATGQEAQPLTQTIEHLENSAHVDSIQRLGNRAMAQLTVNYFEESKARAYRETRFYQKSGATWQRTSPDSTLLGPAKALKIAHFTLLYRAVDADAVYQAAPKLEQLYANIRHDFGLSIIDATATYTIEVATEGVQSLHNVNFIQRKLTISSPTLLSSPVEIAPATLLYQAIIYPLAHLAQIESINQHDAQWQNNFAHWQPIESTLPLWELWQGGGPLATGRAEVVRWLYENGKSATAHPSLPDGYQLLCRTYGIWQTTPAELSIPLACPDAANKPLPAQKTLTLATSWRPQTQYPSKGQTLPASSADAVLTSETIIEYIVATYGRDKLPQLFEAMGEYTTIETLIPALFGISQADFEAGWQAYLAQHY